MNITHIITGLNDGGAEAALARLCIADKDNQFVVISLMGPGKYGTLLNEAGVKVECLNMPAGKATISGIVKLYKLLKKYKPDIVQTWMYHADFIGGVVARLAGVKDIFWGVHHSNLTPEHSKKSTIYIAKACSCLSYFIPKKIICCANKSAAVHSEVGYCKSKLHVIYNGYDLELFTMNQQDESQIKTEFRIDTSTVLLGMVSRFHPFKDHENLINALGLVKKSNYIFKCILVGGGISDRNKALVEWIESNGLEAEVILVGSRNDIPKIMNGIDIHILSSSSEAFPNVLSEAMACGTPCVTTDVGDAAHIVGDTGWVAKPQNSQDLASKIVEAINMKAHSKDAWEARQLKARERIENNFKIETMVSKYNEIWNS